MVLIDEINRAPAKTQSALFEVMEERTVTQDGTTYRHDRALPGAGHPKPHRAGRHLPPARGPARPLPVQAARGLPHAGRGNPDSAGPPRRLRRHATSKRCKPVLSGHRPGRVCASRCASSAWRPTCSNTSPSSWARRGRTRRCTWALRPAPRIALLNGAKALAALRGRDFVTPEDVQFLAAPACCATASCSRPEREMEGGTPDEVVQADCAERWRCRGNVLS
ncbi:MAG: AAA family ATPase [Hymenobacter sp.]